MNANALPYDVVVFDLDGTLTDSEPGIVNCVQYALSKIGMEPPSRKVLRAFIGPPLVDSFMRITGLSETQAIKALDDYRERYFVEGYLENRVYRGIPAMLRTLKARGAYLALATAKPNPGCDAVLKAYDLMKYFDRVVRPEGDDHGSGKADLVRAALPDSYRRACMVGDREFDITGALENGIDAIGAAYGYGGEGELTRAGATHIVDSVSALTDRLLGGDGIMPGKFITMEGPDGCGKSTQHRMLAEWLDACGHDLVVTREPGGCPISERIRAIVLDKVEMGMSDACEALLFAAARAQHVQEVIRPAIARGALVVCDRFVDSSVAYQGIGRDLGVKWVREINRPGVDACMPDLTVLLDIDPEQALSRRVAAETPDRIEKASGGFVRRVYEGYRAMAAAEPLRFQTIDASGAPEEVHARVRRAVSDAI